MLNWIFPILAFNSEGHRSLTSLALSYAFSRFVSSASTRVLKRLGYFATGSERPAGQTELSSLFQRVPEMVVFEDVHIGNLPGGILPFGISGSTFDPNGQVRHYMRSLPTTAPQQAHEASRRYIWHHLYVCWSSMHSAVIAEENAFWQQLRSYPDFMSGVGDLATALHTIEDSYAPGHVTREVGVGTIRCVHAWDDDNKTAHGDWKGHAAYDDPWHDQTSAYFFYKGRDAAGELILTILENLDQDQAQYVANCTPKFQRYFHLDLSPSCK
jgi:hypothetical protein